MMQYDPQKRYDHALSRVCPSLRNILLQIPDRVKQDAQEIRLRVGRPVMIIGSLQNYFVTERAAVISVMRSDLLSATLEQLDETFQAMCGYSVYSYQNDIKNGFLTIQGGHRVGLCGTAVFHNGEIAGIRNISSMNIRISRQISGAADQLLRQLQGDVEGLLLAGAPCSGKTTILRDLARQLSIGKNGPFRKVVVVDERGELGGVCGGLCHNDLGLSDVLNGYPKGEGILRAVRCLSPDVIICDEVGNLADISAIEEGLNAGAAMIASIHAGSLQELKRRKQAQRLLETGAFSQVALLETGRTPGKIQGIYKVGEEDAKTDGLPVGNCGRSGSGISASA